MHEPGTVQYWGDLAAFIVNCLVSSVFNLYVLVNISLGTGAGWLQAIFVRKRELAIEAKSTQQVFPREAEEEGGMTPTPFNELWKRYGVMWACVFLFLGFSNAAYKAVLDAKQPSASPGGVSQTSSAPYSPNTYITGDNNTVIPRPAPVLITGPARERMVAVLKNYPFKATIQCSHNCERTDTDLAENLQGILKDAGWTVNETILGNIAWDKPRTEWITFTVAPTPDAGPGLVEIPPKSPAGQLALGLQEAGISVGFNSSGGVEDELEITLNPQPGT